MRRPAVRLGVFHVSGLGRVYPPCFKFFFLPKGLFTVLSRDNLLGFLSYVGGKICSIKLANRLSF